MNKRERDRERERKRERAETKLREEILMELDRFKTCLPFSSNKFQIQYPSFRVKTTLAHCLPVLLAQSLPNCLYLCTTDSLTHSLAYSTHFLEVKLPYDPVCPCVGRLVGWSFVHWFIDYLFNSIIGSLTYRLTASPWIIPH